MNRFNQYLFLVMMILVTRLPAQLSLSNILEYQLGNLPATEPSNLSTLYDQLNLSYRYDQIRFSTRIESFQTRDRSRSYSVFSQKSVEFEDQEIGVTIGNFYHIIGRGLLLRSYEIPGTVIEDMAFRTRYGFYRDLEGIMGSYTTDIFEINLLYGRPLNNTLPPTQNDNDLWRPHSLQGVEAVFYLSDWQLGGAYLRDETPDRMHEFGSVSVGTILPLDLQVYGEFSQQFGGDDQIGDLSDATAHALYASMNAQFDALGISLEYKDYNEYQLGYNDPPPLVKEHQYLLLNRNTHSVVAVNETGWQSELFYTFGGHVLNINFAKAANELFGKRYDFYEQFVELSYKLNRYTTIKGFFDRNAEDLLGIDDRYTAGLYFESEFLERWGTIIDFEYQTFLLTYSDRETYKNIALLLSVSYAPDLTIGMTAEQSSDPADLPEGKKEGYWLGLNIGYQYSQAHLISFFYGKRRGGNSCTSGICYEILSFEGLEFRLTSTL